MSEKKCRVARYRLVQQLHGLKSILFLSSNRVNILAVEEFFCLQVEIVGNQVRGRSLGDCTLFLWRQLGLKLIGDFLRNLALDGKDIGEIAIISLRPQMCVIARIDQLRVHAHTIAHALHAAFHQMRDSELLRDLAQVARDSSLVLHHRSAANHF